MSGILQTRWGQPLVLVGALACAPAGDGMDSSAGSAAGPATPLLQPEGLAPVSADDDPLASHRPDPLSCHEAAWGPEGGGFEVQTGVCDYAAFDQALPVPLQRGDVLDVTVWHDTLDAAEPAVGHIAVLLDGVVLWEAKVEIPAPSDQLDGVVELDFDPAPDARLGVHLHNHGYNSWRFVAVDLRE